MSMVEKLGRLYEEQRLEARKLAAKAGAEGVSEERAAELVEQMERAADAAEKTAEQLKVFQRVEMLEERRAARRELTPSGTQRAAGTGDGEVTVEALQQRSRLIERRRRGLPMTDREHALASEMFPVERLFQRRLLEIVRPGSATAEETREWDEYVGVARRAWSDPQGTGTNVGGEFVPEYFDDQIRAASAFEGRMADDTGMSVFRNATIGTVNIPTVTDATSKTAAHQVEGADGTTQRLATAETKLNPDKDSVIVPINTELLLGDYVGFESWLTQQVGTWFGRSLNLGRTSGSGTNEPTGIVSGAAGITTAANTGVTETDVNKFVGALDISYWFRPTSHWQMHANTELALISLRSSGQRVFDLAPDRRLILPRIGTGYSFNNRLSEIAAGATVMVAGDMSYYGVAYGGMMRVERDYSVLSDQVLLGWFLHHDGKPINVGSAHPPTVSLAVKS